MKYPLALLLAAACVTPLALQARDDVPTNTRLDSPAGGYHAITAQPAFVEFHDGGKVPAGPGGDVGVNVREVSVAVVPEPGLAGLLGILGAILLLRRRG
ncbi:PEP-CTERM sorting domain-containing protein [Luteolibacter sp. SL250]|uniref:PEP-CTERM sorting domain-containing protein n=1 Tax=Luteolibacter sp. SL250 TaxID=2995170 RepID=UPI002271B3BD|nr:PEP-CTERM sorting domain-containing protein [Luteolibacter sp. SL250]WAC19268.1 PEP-CTERM sorting domain-containing protein [Luteolibacter sp. SL250]